MISCGFERDALLEYRDAALFYAERRAGLGEEFVRAVELVMSEVCESPEKFRPIGDDVRVCRMRRFPYLIYYLFDRERSRVTVYAVAHGRRRADYWRGRLQA